MTLPTTAARSVAVAAALLAAQACVVRGLEAQLLDRFFQASRIYDRAALSDIATVAFNPATDGVVQTFDVIRVERAPERRLAVVDATIRTPGGRVARQTLTATIERRGGRWLVTAVAGGP